MRFMDREAHRAAAGLLGDFRGARKRGWATLTTSALSNAIVRCTRAIRTSSRFCSFSSTIRLPTGCFLIPRCRRARPRVGARGDPRTATSSFSPGRSSDPASLEAVERNIPLRARRRNSPTGRRYPAERYIMVDDKLWLPMPSKSLGPARHDRVAAPGPLHHRRARSAARAGRDAERIGELVDWPLRGCCSRRVRDPPLPHLPTAPRHVRGRGPSPSAGIPRAPASRAPRSDPRCLPIRAPSGARRACDR